MRGKIGDALKRDENTRGNSALDKDIIRVSKP